VGRDVEAGGGSHSVSMSSDTKHILVVKPSSLGDIIHGLQVVESLRVQQPHVKITWVVADAFAPVVRACRTVDSIFVFERKGGLRGFVRLLRQIRQARHYDCVLDLQGLARSGLMTLFARAGRKIGRADAREGACFCYGETVALPEVSEPHAVEVLCQFLPSFGLSNRVEGTLVFDLPNPQLQLPESLDQAILVFPESRREEKNWPYFAEFVTRVANDFPERNLLWCGSAAIADVCPTGPNVYNLAGQTGLLDVIALIQAAGAVLANDSGPIHIAAAVGTPVLALFGPTPPEAYGPYPLQAEQHITLRSDEHTMGSLSVDTVYASFAAQFLPLL
jgi:heptosyltransferase-1